MNFYSYLHITQYKLLSQSIFVSKWRKIKTGNLKYRFMIRYYKNFNWPLRGSYFYVFFYEFIAINNGYYVYFERIF